MLTRCRRFTFWSVVLFAAATLGVPPSAMAQVTTGTIAGHVTDPSGAAVPNASVTLTNQQTGVSIKANTASGGYYAFPLLEPGTYSVTVAAPGFATTTHKDLTLEIQQTLEGDFQLELSRVAQQVNVTGHVPTLNTSSSEVGNVIATRAVEELPLNGRNFSQLAYLVPGTNPGPIGGIRTTGNGNETQRGGAEIIANGARGSFNDYLIDGIDDRDQSVATIKVFPNVEDIQEFKVETANYDAEFASGGAVVNVTTKSGSNTLHGSAFEFFRNSGLDARQFFDADVAPLHQNQFGGSVGGPIRRNKTFFFADYQGTRIHSSTTTLFTVPTAQEIAGDYSTFPGTIYDPATYDATTGLRQAFPNNQIPTSRFDPVAVNLLALFPAANLPGFANNLALNPLQVTTQDEFDVRVDQTISNKDSFFIRETQGWSTVKFPNAPPLVNGKVNPYSYVLSADTNIMPSGQVTLQELHIFSARLLNHFSVGYTRVGLSQIPLDQGLNVAEKLGLKGANTDPVSSAMASLDIAGYSGYDTTFTPEIVPQNTWQVSDTLALISGAHSIKFGASVIRNDFGFFQLAAPSGVLSYDGVYTNDPTTGNGGDGFADFLLGLPDGAEKSELVRGVPQVFYTEIGAFAQDQWRVRPNLTLTLGARYDLFTPPVEKYDRQSDFDPATGEMLVAGQNGVSRNILDTQYHDFSPRIGLAWHATPKNVIRAGYGLFYFNEQGTGSSARLFIDYPLDKEFITACSSTIPCLQTSDGIPAPVSVAATRPLVVYQPLANQTPNVQQWNLTVEHELRPNFVLSAVYVGTKGTHLNLAIDENVAFPGPGPVTPRRPFPAFSKISSWEPRGNSSYNGLQLSAIKKMSQSLSFIAAYTWSKSLDYGGGGNSSDGDPRINIQDPRNLRGSRGLSSFDFRQRFTLSSIYQLPFGQGQKFASGASGLVERAIGGWQLGGILTLQSGAPTSPVFHSGTANTGTFTRPDRICNGNLPDSNRSVNMWFDTSCFVAAPPYQFGNSGRNIIIGPGFESLDLELEKNFQLTEKWGLEFRSEFFNLLNHANFGLPDRHIGSSSAGEISDVISNARLIQFALRLHF